MSTSTGMSLRLSIIGAMTAIFRATATAAFFMPLLLAIRRPQALRADHLPTRVSKVVAASNRYAGTISRTEDEEDGGEEVKQIPFLKSYTVFNVEQIGGLPEHYYLKPEPVTEPLERIAHADAFFAATRADIRHGGGQAYYSGSSDHVQMPCFESFRSPEAYYATLAHELIHWTRHETRLGREIGRTKWGDEGYAREELVAEQGAAFLCADLALTPEPGADHAAYIQSWLKVLKNDKRAIFSAAAHAQRAAAFLHGLQSSSGIEDGAAA